MGKDCIWNSLQKKKQEIFLKFVKCKMLGAIQGKMSSRQLDIQLWNSEWKSRPDTEL